MMGWGGWIVGTVKPSHPPYIDRKRRVNNMSKATPAKRRWKKGYYKRHQIHNLNSHGRFDNDECRMILNHNIPDVRLAEILGRSLMSIQIKRVRLKTKTHTLHLGW